MNEIREATRLRRDILKHKPAPHPRHDAVVTHRARMEDIEMRLRYIPDRDILMPNSLSDYLKAVEHGAEISLEEMAQTILEDINDQVIPSWLEITLHRSSGHTKHDVRIEDRQPHWQDRGLLDRLEP